MASALRTATAAVRSFFGSRSDAERSSYLIVDGRPGHYFLYDVYKGLPGSRLVLFDEDIREPFDAPLDRLRHMMTPDLRAIMFVTIEELIYGPSKDAFVRFLRETGARCTGIVHRLPQTQDRIRALQTAAQHMKAVIVLAPELAEILSARYGIANTRYLPLHSPFATLLPDDPQRIRRRVGAANGQTIFTVMGEARPGKGIELLLEALAHIPADDLASMFFLFGGRDRLGRDQITSAMTAAGARGLVDLRESVDPLQYNILSDTEFAEYVAATDIGLLLYQHAQRDCMSGVAPNYVWAGKPIVATADSIVGRIVSKHALGSVVVEESPQALAAALVTAMHDVRNGWRPPHSYTAFRAELAQQNVLARLGEIFDSPAV